MLYEAKASGKGNLDGELTATLQWLQHAPKAAARANMNEGEYLKAYADQMNRLASATAEQAGTHEIPQELQERRLEHREDIRPKQQTRSFTKSR